MTTGEAVGEARDRDGATAPLEAPPGADEDERTRSVLRPPAGMSPQPQLWACPERGCEHCEWGSVDHPFEHEVCPRHGRALEPALGGR